MCLGSIPLLIKQIFAQGFVLLKWELELDEDNHNDCNDGQSILSIISETSSFNTQATLRNTNPKITTINNDRYILTLPK